MKQVTTKIKVDFLNILTFCKQNYKLLDRFNKDSNKEKGGRRENIRKCKQRIWSKKYLTPKTA